MLKRIKQSFQNAVSKNGSYSVGITAVVIAIVIVINMIAGQLPEKFRNIDVSDKNIYQISKTSKKILKKLDKDITIRVFAEKKSADERIKTFLNKYVSLSDKITVKWIDPVLHPAQLTKYNVEENTILVSCKDTDKSKALLFTDIIVMDEYSYYTTGSATETEFDADGQLTSALNYVTSDTQKKIYYTTGHGEQTFSSSVSELLDKNNMTEEELNLMMNNEIPEDCDLLFMYAPTKDITEDEKKLLETYMEEGGKVYIMLGEPEDKMTNLDAFLKEYGMERTEGYIADMQRCYQGNYYYIFPEISASGELAEGLSSDMVLLVNAHGFQVTDPERDTITTTEFMTTSSEAYAVTEDSQDQGTYTLGAVAEEDDGRLTVVSADTLIDSQVTEGFSTLENLDLFMNTVSANFDDVDNVAIKAKSLEVTYNTMQHGGLISLLVIFGIPAGILIFGFVRWWKRRKA